jgi:hypothetical protein
MHAKFDEFGVLARLFVPDLTGPRALPVTSPETAINRCDFGAACTGCVRCRQPRWWR